MMHGRPNIKTCFDRFLQNFVRWFRPQNLYSYVSLNDGDTLWEMLR